MPLVIKYTGAAQTFLDASLNPADTRLTADAEAKGSFGATRAQLIIKFSLISPPTGVSNEDGCGPNEFTLAMDYTRSITTFKDHSQMFVFWDTGMMCSTPGPAGMASYRGWADGHIVGGTGRFEGTTGTVHTDFGGYDLSGPFVYEGPPFPSFGSFSGIVDGKVFFPHHR